MVAAVLTLAEALVPQSRSSSDTHNNFFPGWLSFIAINFALLMAALLVFKRLMAPAGTSAAIATAILGVFLTFNDVVKGFFWSAHTQMWNVLVPLISISPSLALLQRPVRSWRFMIATGLLLGIGLLAYPSLVVCAVSAVAAIAFGYYGNRETSPLPILAKVCVFLIFFTLPIMIWIGIIRWKTGSFYVAEAQSIFREFVWIIDSWKAGGIDALLRQTQTFLREYILRFLEGLWPMLILLTIICFMPAQRLNTVIRERASVLGAAAITFVVCSCFFALVGFYRNRLAFNAVVPVFVVASALLVTGLERMPKPRAVMTLLSISTVSVGYIIFALVRITWPY